MPCKIKIFDPDKKKLISYTCHEVRDCIDGWKEEFRKKNATDSIKIDHYYKEYCQSLDDFIAQCKCAKPPIEEKIRWAKEKRERGEGPW